MIRMRPIASRRSRCEARGAAATQGPHDRRTVLAAPGSPRREWLAMTVLRMAQPAPLRRRA